MGLRLRPRNLHPRPTSREHRLALCHGVRLCEVSRSASAQLYPALQPAVPTSSRDLTPYPLIDPIAQRRLGGGIGIGGAIRGGKQFD